MMASCSPSARTRLMARDDKEAVFDSLKEEGDMRVRKPIAQAGTLGSTSLASLLPRCPAHLSEVALTRASSMSRYASNRDSLSSLKRMLQSGRGHIRP